MYEYHTKINNKQIQEINSHTRNRTTNHVQSQSNPDMLRSTPSTNTNAYIELPASSLASMGNSVGDLPINSSMTAKNVNIGVQGSNMLISADVYDSFWGKIGTATTTVAPTAA